MIKKTTNILLRLKYGANGEPNRKLNILLPEHNMKTKPVASFNVILISRVGCPACPDKWHAR
jgi:hypothetical protein